MSINTIANNPVGSTAADTKPLHRPTHHHTQGMPQSKFTVQQPSPLLAQVRTGPGRMTSIPYIPVDQRTRKFIIDLYSAALNPRARLNRTVLTFTYPKLMNLVGRYGFNRVTSVLIRGLYDNDHRIRYAAIITLPLVSPSTRMVAYHIIKTLIYDRNKNNQDACVKILGNMGPIVVPWLLKANALMWPHWKVRLNAIKVLSHWYVVNSAHKAIPDLRKLLNDVHPQVSSRAIVALRVLRSKNMAKIWWNVLLRGANRQRRIEAARRLEMILPTGDSRFDRKMLTSINHIARHDRDASLRKAAQDALRKIRVSRLPPKRKF